MASCGLFIGLFLGIAIDATLLVQTKNEFGFKTNSDELYSISSVETIVDSRFKLLAADFQDQIDYLKGKFVKERKSANEGVIESQFRHGIKKRQTKTLTSKLNKFENMNSSCTFFYPDYPDASYEKSKHVTMELLKSGKEEVKKQEKSKSKPICKHSTPFCTFIHPDHHGVGRVNGNNSTAVTNNEMAQDPTVVNQTTTIFEDNLSGEIELLKIQTRDQSKRIDQLEEKVAMLQNTSLVSSALTRENNEDKLRNEAPYKNGKVAKALTPPSSCQDLAMLDYYLDGLYLVKNQQTKKVQTVFCKFSADNKVTQELVGTVEIKTKKAHFYVQRNSTFSTPNAVIPFQLARLNEGNAFGLASGTFIAPVAGIYYFQFSAVKDFSPNYFVVRLRVNNVNVGSTTTNSNLSNTGVSLSASLRLAMGDRVNLFSCCGGVLVEDSTHLTHFTGWLAEEDF